jgi:hypothetical protein
MGSGRMQEELGAAMAADQRLGAMFMNMMPVDITEPSDVADTVLFLASDESKFITAHEIAPDAGVTEFWALDTRRRLRDSADHTSGPITRRGRSRVRQTSQRSYG